MLYLCRIEIDQRLAREDSAPRVISAFNLFQTPEAIAAQMAAVLVEAGRPIGRCLEPSAGLGRLYRAVRAIDQAAPIVLVDESPGCCSELFAITNGDQAAELFQGDFLTMDSGRLGGRFDSIIMNPPFKLCADCRHIEHAARLLKPGGRLVSLCAAGPRQVKRLQPIADRWELLPAGSFRSEGTAVNVALLVIDR